MLAHQQIYGKNSKLYIFLFMIAVSEPGKRNARGEAAVLGVVLAVIIINICHVYTSFNLDLKI